MAAGGGNVQAISAQFSADVSDFVSALSHAMSASQSMQSSAANLAAAFNQATPAASAAGQGVQAAGQGAQSAGSAFSSAIGGVSDFLGAISSVASAALGAGQAVIDGALAFKNFAQSVSDTVNSLFDINEATETASIAFKYLTGSSAAAGDEMQALNDFAASTPWPTDQIRALGEHMLAMGMDASDVVPRMKAVGDAVAAMGGGVPQIAAVIAELQKMSDQGKITQRQMDVLIQQGFPAWQALAAGMGTSVDEAVAKVRSGTLDTKQAIDAMLSGAESKFAGAMQDQMDTMTGQLNKFKDNWNTMWQSLSGGAFSAVEATMKGVNEILVQGVQPALNDINDAIKQVVDDTADWAKNTKEGQQTVSDLNETFKALIATVKFLLDGIAGIIMILHDLGPILKSAFDVIMWPTQLFFQAIDQVKQLTGQTQDLSTTNSKAAASTKDLSTANSQASSSASSASSAMNQMGSAASSTSTSMHTAASSVGVLQQSVSNMGTVWSSTATSANSFSVTASDVGTHAKAAASALDSTGKSAGTLSSDFRDASQESVFFQGQLDKQAQAHLTLQQQLDNTSKGIGTLKAHFTDLAGQDLKWKATDDLKQAQTETRSLTNLWLNLLDLMHNLGMSGLGSSTPASGGTIGIPSYASGVENFEGGLAQVHQDEIIALPRGSSVYPVTGGPALAPISLGGGSAGGSSSPIVVQLVSDSRVLAETVFPHLSSMAREITGRR
jgi:tape measure domain-containing protein